MKFLVKQHDQEPFRDKIAHEIINELILHDHTEVSGEEKVNFIFNLTNMENPRPVRRHSQAEFVVSLAVLNRPSQDLRSECYTTLIKTLSNLMICVKPSGNCIAPEIFCITPEVGFYHYPYQPERVFDTIAPIVSSHMVIRNKMTTDLPQKYHNSTPLVQQLKCFGEVLDKLGVLPTPFPLEDVLDKESIEHLFNIFSIKGLSYGNLSIRDHIPELGANTFWMTARGVNKAKLNGIGQDILLVTGYDEETQQILVSTPPVHDIRARVSVDAIEHTLIYRAFPNVGAIVHVHAWMKDVPCTRQNYPCGTSELAEEVVELLKQTDQPHRTVVGLKNHGLTITGPDLNDIFNRIRGNLLTTVPMFDRINNQ